MASEKIEIRIVGLTPDLKEADKAAKKLNGTLDKTEDTSSSLGMSFGKFASAAKVGAVAIGAAFVAGSGALLKFGSELETTRIQFRTMLGGDKEAADGLIKQLNQFADATAFTNQKVQQGARTLLAFGTAQEKILPTLGMLGDVSAGTGKDLQELSVIYGQIQGAGRLMGQDLLQLINAGFNPLQTISKRTGESMGELKDRMSKGAISFQEVEQAFKDATSEGGLFNNMSEQLSQTFEGRMSTMTGKAQSFAMQLGEPLLKPIKDVMGLTISWMDGFLKDGDKMQSLIHGIQDGIVFVANAFVRLWNIIKPIADPLVELFTEVWGLLGDIGSLFGGGSGLGNIFKQFFAAVRADTVVLIEGIKGVIQGIRSLIAFASGDMTEGKSLWEKAGQTLGGAFQKGVEAGNKTLAAFDAPDKFTRESLFGTGESGAGSGIGGIGAGMGSTTSGAANSGTVSTASGNVTGTSQKTININVGKLIEELSIKTNNMVEGVEQTKEALIEALLTVLNESNRIAVQ